MDSSLVQVLVDLHLADARASLAEDIALGDSLRTLVYDAHRLDSTQLHSRLAQVTERPGAASALAEAVETQLSTERRAPSP